MDDYENLYFGQKNCITKENRKKPLKKKIVCNDKISEWSACGMIYI